MLCDKFEIIFIDSLFLFFNDSGILYNYDMVFDSLVCKLIFCYQYSIRKEDKVMLLYFFYDIVRDVLFYCEYRLSYFMKKEVFDGSWQFVYDFFL